MFFKIRAAVLGEKTSGGRHPRAVGCDSGILEYRREELEADHRGKTGF